MSNPHDALIAPEAALARRAEHAAPQLTRVDARALLLFADNLVPAAVAAASAAPREERAGQALLWRGSFGGRPITLCAPGIGAPAAALATEKMVAAGARLLLGVGYGGGLGGYGRGAVVAVDGTLRGEEGLSGHYGAVGRVVAADGPLVSALRPGAEAAGLAVTTDAPYRETREKVAAWREAGALAVDMETAGLLAPAAFRGVRAAGLLVITDTLGEEWGPAPPGSVQDAAQRALTLALRTLAVEEP